MIISENTTFYSEGEYWPRCPLCRTSLTVTQQLPLETLVEHTGDPNGKVSLKDAYSCLNKPDCQAASDEVVWNSNGELYSGKVFYYYKEGLPWIDSNDAPFGTFQRKLNAENNHDNDWTILKLPWLKFKRVYSYQSNPNGDILGRTGRTQIWLKNGTGYTLYSNGFRMLIFCLKSYGRHKRIGMNVYDSFYPGDWDKRWWKRLSAWMLRVRHPLEAKYVLEHNKPRWR